MYDFLIVGAGLFGAVFAHEATKRGKKCLVIEKRNRVGGNIYTEDIEGICVHTYGPHIFHTKNRKVWEYVQTFAEFNAFVNCPIAFYKDEVYNMPFNMNTFSRLWGIKTPQEAKAIIDKQVQEAGITEPKWMYFTLALIGNLCFYLYDILLDRFMIWYILKLRRRMKF